MIIKYLATFFGVGLITKFEGTAATFVSAILFYALINLLNLSVFFLCLISFPLFFLSWYIVVKYQIGSSDPDPKEIVIDEVLGTFICLLALPISSNPIMYLITSFILFRILDYFKPSIIYRFQRQNTNLSIILDDIMASLFTLLIVLLVDINGLFDALSITA